MKTILNKLASAIPPTKREVEQLLTLDTASEDFYTLLYLARRYAGKTFGGRGYVFAQIGINAEPCSVGCKFCSMATGHYVLPERWQKSADEVIAGVQGLVAERADDIFLMTTADYPVERFIEIGRSVAPCIPPDIRLVANIGDFDLPTAMRLKEAGFTGAYHIVRLREGIDTGMSVERRVATIEAIRAAGMELYYCVEPIGPEHGHDEIATEILRARDYGVEAMAVMRRTPVEGTPLWEFGAISTPEICKIAAVTMLVVRPSRSMNVHEVTEMSLLAGVNQLYAEAGANPRDTDDNTENSRGFNIAALRKMLQNSALV